MDTTIYAFYSELDEIEKLILYFETEKKLAQEFEISESQNDIFLNELSLKLKNFRISKLKFNYNSIIISLYGSFERFIELTIINYLEIINEIVKEYLKLPNIILKKHTPLSITLINKIEQSKYKGPLTKEIIIRNLHTCINTIESYSLNKEAFSQHTANFRIQVIDENFKCIGINDLSENVIKQDVFQKYLINQKGIDPSSDLLNGTDNLQLINDLAELRNYVAHGIENEIIENNILLEFIQFFRTFSSALIDVLKDNILALNIEFNGLMLGKITNTYSSGSIICVYTNGHTIKKNQTIFAKSTSSIISAKILSIQLNGDNIDISEGENIEISIKINSRFKDNYTLYTF